MKKIASVLIILLVVLVLAGGAFYGGMKYAGTKTPAFISNFGNLSAEEIQQRMQQMGQAGTLPGNPGGGANRAGGQFLAGQILSKDENSLTLKMQDGSTKIIFFSPASEISKTAAGTADDLAAGKTVMVSGSANDDGSITAKSIQIRPDTQPEQ